MLTKEQTKFQMICDVLKDQFNWNNVSYNGNDKNEAFLHVDGKLYVLGLHANTGIALTHGTDFMKAIDLVCAYNTSDEFLYNQCKEIDAKCRKILGLS